MMLVRESISRGAAMMLMNKNAASTSATGTPADVMSHGLAAATTSRPNPVIQGTIIVVYFLAFG